MARGALVYAENCASCHGETGRGNGAAGNDLSPPPANLAWFARMPMNRWDPFMYWTIAQGGQAFGTEMPAFEVTLPRNDIWAVTRYVQQQLGGSK
jgi:mono/diheme cytochrome c family protein